jgi:hypothetical protein
LKSFTVRFKPKKTMVDCFSGRVLSNKEVLRLCEKHSLTTNAEELLTDTVNAKSRRLVVYNPHFPNGPYIWAMRFTKAISLKAQEAVLAAYAALINHGNPKQYTGEKSSNRSTTPALHIGVWELYSSVPRISNDTRKQDSATFALIRKFCDVVKTYIVPELQGYINRYMPEQAQLTAELASSGYSKTDNF